MSSFNVNANGTNTNAPFMQQLALTGGKVFVEHQHESLGTVRPF
jgi:hypothetical protein